jgi:hypothetical protein
MKFLSSALLLLTASATAQAALPVGTFSHEFTSIKDAPVWSVLSKAGTYKILTHGDGKRRSAHVLTPGERKAFWTQMDWAPGSHEDAECIGSAAELICYVPTKTREFIPELRSKATDFFHFDKMGGIMAIKKSQR